MTKPLDKKYFKDFSSGITVEELIEVLKEYPKDALVTVLGSPSVYIHGENDGSTIIFDDNDLAEEYNERNDEDD